MAPKKGTPQLDPTNDAKVYSMKSLSALSEMFLYCYLGMTLTVTRDSYVCSLPFSGVVLASRYCTPLLCLPPVCKTHLSRSLRNINIIRHSWGLSFLTLLACLVCDA